MSAHKSIRAEITLSQALAHWFNRDIRAAQKLLRRVDSDSDIIHARAIELDSYCYLAQDRLHEAARCLSTTIVRLDSCKNKDAGLGARSIMALAAIGVELFDAEVMRFAESRYGTMEWATGVAAERSMTEYHIGVYSDFLGLHEKAFTFLLRALDNAPSDNLRASVYAALSKAAEHVGNTVVAKCFASRAVVLLRSVSNNNQNRELCDSLLLVAEIVCKYDLQSARDLFLRYQSLPSDLRLASSGSNGRLGHEFLVEGQLFDAAGNIEAARSFLRRAHDLFVSSNHIFRATLAAIALANLGDDAMKWYVVGLAKGFERWLKDRQADFMQNDSETLALVDVARLSASQWEVVHLVCKGLTNREIAQARGVGVQTIKNMLSGQIFKALGVSTRADLIARVENEQNRNATMHPDRIEIA